MGLTTQVWAAEGCPEGKYIIQDSQQDYHLSA